MSWILWLISAGVMLAGLGTLAYALLGRRVGQEPHCRACGFNLAGLAHDTVGSRCPECGGSLGAAGVRIGRPRLRRPAAFAGAVLLVAGLGVAGFAARGVINVPMASRPVWWLSWDVGHGAAADADAAIAELWRRHEQDGLSFRVLADLIEPALAVHASAPNVRWRGQNLPATLDAAGYGPWQQVLYTAERDDLLTPAQRSRFYQQAVLGPNGDWSMVERYRLVAPAEELRLQPPSPPAPRCEGWVVSVPEAVSVRVDGVEVGPKATQIASWVAQPGDGTGSIGSYGVTTHSPRSLGGAVLTGLKPGRHRVEVAWRAKIFLPGEGFDPNAQDLKSRFLGDATADLVVDVPVQVVQVEVFASIGEAIELVDSTTPGAQPVPLRVGHAHLGAPQITIESNGMNARLDLVMESRVLAGEPPVLMTESEARTSGRASAAATLVDVSPGEAWVVADVRLRVNGVLYPPDGKFASSAAFEPEPWGHSVGVLLRADDLPADATEAEVVLLPSPDMAMRYTEVDRLWNEPIVLGPVPIVREDDEGDLDEEAGSEGS